MIIVYNKHNLTKVLKMTKNSSWGSIDTSLLHDKINKEYDNILHSYAKTYSELLKNNELKIFGALEEKEFDGKIKKMFENNGISINTNSQLSQKIDKDKKQIENDLASTPKKSKNRADILEKGIEELNQKTFSLPQNLLNTLSSQKDSQDTEYVLPDVHIKSDTKLKEKPLTDEEQKQLEENCNFIADMIQESFKSNVLEYLSEYYDSTSKDEKNTLDDNFKNKMEKKVKDYGLEYKEFDSLFNETKQQYKEYIDADKSLDLKTKIIAFAAKITKPFSQKLSKTIINNLSDKQKEVLTYNKHKKFGNISINMGKGYNAASKALHQQSKKTRDEIFDVIQKMEKKRLQSSQNPSQSQNNKKTQSHQKNKGRFGPGF